MNEIIKNNSADRTEMECGSQHYDKRITNVTDQLLDELHAEHSGEKTISVPVAEIASLGGGVSSLIPAIRKVTQTSTTNADGLYRLATVDPPGITVDLVCIFGLCVNKSEIVN